MNVPHGLPLIKWNLRYRYQLTIPEIHPSLHNEGLRFYPASPTPATFRDGTQSLCLDGPMTTPLDQKIWLPDAIFKTAESCLWNSVSSAFSALAAYAIHGQSTRKDRDLIKLIKQVYYFVLLINKGLMKCLYVLQNFISW